MGVVLADSVSAGKLVGNLDSDASNYIGIGEEVIVTITADYVGAQAFTTGSNLYGYVITGVDIHVRDTSTSTTALVSIYSSNESSNRPGSKLYDFTGSVASSGVQRFTAPSGAVLNGSTTYFLRISDELGSSTFSVNITGSDDEDSNSASGWSVADSSLLSANGGGSWTPNVHGRSIQIAVHGDPLFKPHDITGNFVLGTGSGSEIKGLWSDGGTLWTLDEADSKALGYDLVGGSLVRNSGKDFSVLGNQGSGVDSDNELVYVMDIFVGDNDDTLARAYTLSGTRRSGDDINISDHHADGGSSGFWSNGTILLVSNDAIKNVSVYLNGVYDSSKNFKPSNACGISHGVWSDGETLWVVASHCGTPVEGSFFGTGVGLQAFRLSDFSRDSVRDIPLGANDAPRGLWGDGETLWVGRDRTGSGSNDEVFYYKYRNNAYGLKLHGRAFVGETLFARTSSIKDFNGMPDSPVFSYQWQYGDGSDIAGATGSTYNVTSADLGKSVRVKVSFTDKARYEEQVFSGFTSEVGVRTSAVSPDAFTGNFVLGTGSGSEIKGLWSDGDTLWTLDETAEKAFAYDLVGGSLVRNSGKDFSVLGDEGSGVDSDNELVYVMDILVGDDDDTFARAYTLSGTRRSGDDINISDHGLPSGSSGFWSNGTILLVSNDAIKNVSVYLNGVYDPSKNFKPSNACGISHGVWSDGETLWVVASHCGTPVEGSFFGTGVELQAYRLSDFSRDSVRDIPLGANDAPRGLWGDGETLWVGRDRTGSGSNDEVFYYKYRNNAYGLKLHGRAYVGETLFADTSGVEDFNGMPDSPVFSYQWQYGDGSDIAGATGSTYNVTSADLGKSVRVKVMFTDKARYEEQVFSPFTPEVGEQDFVLDSGNGDLWGVWSDGQVMWVVDDVDDKVYAYDAYPNVLNSGQTFDLASVNDDPRGVWSDGVTMWVAEGGNESTDRVYAYHMSNKSRDSSKDFSMSDSGQVYFPRGLWSDGEIMYVAKDRSGHGFGYVHAYNISSGDSVSDKHFSLAFGNGEPGGMWSDGETMWVLDYRNGVLRDRVYAYNLSDLSASSYNTGLTRVFDKDITLSSENNGSRGLWSDGVTLWVGDVNADRLFSYPVETAERTADFDRLVWAGNNHPWGVWVDSPARTMYVVDYQDGVYAYDLFTKVPLLYRSFDLDSNNIKPRGLWSDGVTMWVVDVGVGTDDRAFAYMLSGGVRDSSNDFSLSDSGNAFFPTGVWSDGVTLWVANARAVGTSGYVRAYRMSDGSLDESKSFALESGHDDPVSVWSDGFFMWVVDADDGVVAYDLSGEVPVFAGVFELSLENVFPTGVWSDGVVFWVADSDADRVYAYDVAGLTGGFVPLAPDAPTLFAFQANSLSVVWSEPRNYGPVVDDYDVQYREDGNGTFSNWSHDGNSTVATIGGLKGGTLYGVRVRAGNVNGPGEWSDVSNYTTVNVTLNSPPVFSSSSSFFVNENSGSVGMVVASDGNTEDSVTGFSVSGGVDGSLFSITNAGVLTFDSVPNYESPVDVGGDNEYNLVVRVTSGTGGRVRTATQSITVSVVDVAEAPSRPGAPVLSSPLSTSLRVAWSAPSNTGPVINDYDVEYRQGSSGSFSSRSHSDNSTSTTITGLTASTLYEVRVRASNAEGTSGWSQTASFTTGSVATNNNPVFTSSSSFSVNENSRSVGTVTASDGDGQDSVNGYSVSGGVDSSRFSITSGGVLTFDSAPNYESPVDVGGDNEYNLVVAARSGTGSRVRTATQSITVRVDDVAEAPSTPSAPVLSSSTSTSLSVTWSAPGNTGPPINDYDVQYRQGTTGSFSNQSHSGNGTSTTITGLSASTLYEVRVRAGNAEGTSGWSQTSSFTTGSAPQVTNNVPSFTSSSSFFVNENSRSVGTVVASDGDGQDSVTGYSISGGVDSSLFSITNNGGVLTFNSAPNYESPSDDGGNNVYNLVVTARSGSGGRVRSATQSIVVSVDDVAEAPSRPGAPVLSSPSSTSLSVGWSAPSNTGPPIIDYDVEYRQGSSGSFSSRSHFGTLRSATITGLSASTLYEVRVRASNAEGTSVWSQTASFTTGSSTPPPATNADPVFTSISSFSVNENSRSVGTVTASDSDPQDSVTDYSVSGGVDSSRFSITNAGVLTFNSAPNYESPSDDGGNNVYNLVVTARSGSGGRVRSATQSIVVSVDDVAEGVAVVPSRDVVLVYTCG